VTPSSKVVGDMAIFMTSNGLSAEDIYTKGPSLSFPESVKDFFKGGLGQPYGGFPKQLQEIILKGEKPIEGRPNDNIAPIEFEADFNIFTDKFPESAGLLDYLSFKMYPKVYEDFYKSQQLYGDISKLATPAFLFGLKQDEEIMINIDEGKDILVKLLFVSEPDELGICTVSFDLNGQQRRLRIKNNKVKVLKQSHAKAGAKGDIGAPLQGKLSRVMVKVGDEVKKNAPLYVIEAMKMESIVSAPYDGKISRVLLSEGTVVEQEDLVLSIEESVVLPEKEADYLFVYGTLRHEFGNELHKIIAKNSEFEGMASYQGEMYMVAEFPGIVPSESVSNQVVGELYKINSTEKLFAILDDYEEYDPNNEADSLYVRKKISLSFGGMLIDSWAYLYNKSLDYLEKIESGDFLKR
jgi:pyruvate carboxylase